MDDAQVTRILKYIGDAVETCEKDTDYILGVSISLEISDVEFKFEWNGEKFLPATVERSGRY